VIVSFLIASTIATLYGSYKAKRKFQIEFGVMSISKIYLMSAVASIPSILLLYSKLIPTLIKSLTPSFLLSTLSVLPDFADLGLGGLLYFLVYITLLPLTECVTSSEIETIAHVTRKIKGLSLFVKPVLKYQRKLCRQKQQV
jgi:hypothetical protein